MAKIEWVERRLVEWSEWVRSGGASDRGTGYPVKNCLHADWGAPSVAVRGLPKIVPKGLGAATHAQVAQLSVTLQQTLVLHYLEQRTARLIAQSLGCAASTVDARLWRAHALLAGSMRR